MIDFFDTNANLKKLALKFISQKSQTVTYKEMKDRIKEEEIKLHKIPSTLLLLKAYPQLEFIIQVMASLQIGKKIALLSPHISEMELNARRDLIQSGAELNLNSEIVWERSSSRSPLHPETALILFTSGSTGIPKGVQLSLKNIQANRDAVIQSLEFRKTSEQTLFLPLSYSYGILGQLLPGLYCGQSICIPSKFSDTKDLLQNSEARGMWSGVPSHWETLLRISDAFPEKCREITHVISAGAPMSLDLRKRLLERFPSATVYNNYGQTEASPRILSLSSSHPQFLSPMSSASGTPYCNGSVGFPVGDFEIKLSKDHELLAKGSQVMLGYLGDQTGTEEKIKEGWLHTGDLAEISQEGLVSILGRKDELFNIAGERTSPIEIETVLKALPEIKDAAISIEADPLYGAKLTGFLVYSDLNHKLEKSILVKRLSENLSPIKIPREFYKIDTIPKNSHGKISRQALKALQVEDRRLR